MIVIIGHGGFDGDTFIPHLPSQQRLMLHAARGTLLPLENLLIALGEGCTNALRTLGDEGYRTVENYSLEPLQPQLIKKVLAFQQSGSGVRIVLVGSAEWKEHFPSTRFCETPGICQPESGAHSCNGILGKMPGKKWTLLACSSASSTGETMTLATESMASDPSGQRRQDLQSKRGQFRRWISEADPQVGEVLDFIRGIAKPQRAIFTAEKDVDAIVEACQMIQSNLTSQDSTIGGVLSLASAIDRSDPDVKDYILNQPIVREYVDRRLWPSLLQIGQSFDEQGWYGLWECFLGNGPDDLTETARELIFNPFGESGDALTGAMNGLRQQLAEATYLVDEFVYLEGQAREDLWNEIPAEQRIFLQKTGYFKDRDPYDDGSGSEDGNSHPVDDVNDGMDMDSYEE